MSIITDSTEHPEDCAIKIVADALRVLKTRDGIEIPDELIVERARNTVAALEGALAPPTALTDAAVAVAALLADPFDRDARAEARIWLRAWETAQKANHSTSTTPGAAVRS